VPPLPTPSDADVVVPLALARVPARSVLALGEAGAAWAAAFARQGVRDVRTVALEESLELDRSFDLAVAVHVAERLAPHAAERLVAGLARLAPVVLFAAAIPGQGGAGHRNEQWPDWWAARFERAGLRVVDGLRATIWDDPRVDWRTAQNLLLFATPEAIAASPLLCADRMQTRPQALARVHPRPIEEAAARASSRRCLGGFRGLVARLVAAAGGTVRSGRRSASGTS
jgi:hypothetical protein